VSCFCGHARFAEDSEHAGARLEPSLTFGGSNSPRKRVAPNFASRRLIQRELLLHESGVVGLREEAAGVPGAPRRGCALDKRGAEKPEVNEEARGKRGGNG